MSEVTQRNMSSTPTAGNAIWGFIDIGGGVTLADAYAAKVAGKPLAHGDAYYVAGGWHFGSFLPMLAFGQTHDHETGMKNRQLSASIRYDFAPNLALKAQVTRFNARDGNVLVTAAQEGSTDYNSKKIDALSVGLDFVF
jgi:hypothetical protein